MHVLSVILVALPAVLAQSPVWGQYRRYHLHFRKHLRCCQPGSSNPPPAVTRSSIAPSQPQPTNTNPPPTGNVLHAKFIGKGKVYYGTSIGQYHLSNTRILDIVKASFGQITHKKSIKWYAHKPTHGSFNYTNANRIVAFAQQNSKLMRGHTLL
ncbi:hypothetical protein B0I35DRAFT_415027 [Stachybotrys elegans]|uniref:GH10 domain-containing protein n=1 Tax=Stachybotrys elegans TaxID=80388 RepID=A0A8K0SDK1_9HYPO|nr:hypothetical protein B0I35DRAFT_415027 [Stachybotrys elegans]